MKLPFSSMMYYIDIFCRKYSEYPEIYELNEEINKIYNTSNDQQFQERLPEVISLLELLESSLQKVSPLYAFKTRNLIYYCKEHASTLLRSTSMKAKYTQRPLENPNARLSIEEIKEKIFIRTFHSEWLKMNPKYIPEARESELQQKYAAYLWNAANGNNAVMADRMHFFLTDPRTKVVVFDAVLSGEIFGQSNIAASSRVIFYNPNTKEASFIHYVVQNLEEQRISEVIRHEMAGHGVEDLANEDIGQESLNPYTDKQTKNIYHKVREACDRNIQYLLDHPDDPAVKKTFSDLESELNKIPISKLKLKISKKQLNALKANGNAKKDASLIFPKIGTSVDGLEVHITDIKEHPAAPLSPELAVHGAKSEDMHAADVVVEILRPEDIVGHAVHHISEIAEAYPPHQRDAEEYAHHISILPEGFRKRVCPERYEFDEKQITTYYRHRREKAEWLLEDRSDVLAAFRPDSQSCLRPATSLPSQAKLNQKNLQYQFRKLDALIDKIKQRYKKFMGVEYSPKKQKPFGRLLEDTNKLKAQIYKLPLSAIRRKLEYLLKEAERIDKGTSAIKSTEYGSKFFKTCANPSANFWSQPMCVAGENLLLLGAGSHVNLLGR